MQNSQMAHSLKEVWNKHLGGWREREAVARQLGPLAALLGQWGDVLRTLFRHAMVDKVAAVREAAIAAVPAFHEALRDHPDLLGLVRADFHALASDESYRRRATYVACSHALLENAQGHELVNNPQFSSAISSLAEDAVVDVRIGVARLVGVTCELYFRDRRSRPQWLIETAQHLLKDDSPEVRSYVYFMTVAESPLARFKLKRQPSTGGNPGTFATFSRPPPPAPLLAADQIQEPTAVPDTLELNLTPSHMQTDLVVPDSATRDGVDLENAKELG